ncbi:MAG: hypothetical protein WA063_05520 [Minisyncoccia bacterium]
MLSVDDEKGGPYHGPYAWPGGVPIASVELVQEARKTQELKIFVREDTEDLVIGIIAEEMGIIPENQREIIKDIALQMSYT